MDSNPDGLKVNNESFTKWAQRIRWLKQVYEAKFMPEETKNDEPLEFELPRVLADRLYAFRHDIAPAIIGRAPDVLFVSRKGVPRARSTSHAAVRQRSSR